MAVDCLTQERLKELLDYDPETGIFRWRVYRSYRAKAGDVAGCASDYIRICVDHVDYLAQRLAWLYMTGQWPSAFIDHKDGDRFNNRWSNLRDVPVAGNAENRAHPSLGVSWSAQRRKFVAQIKHDGRSRMIGRFDTFEEARAAYLAEKRAHHSWALRDL